MAEQQYAISTEEFDRLFDEGEVDILQYFDMDHATRPGLQPHTVAIDLPGPVFAAVERECEKTGTPINELLEGWIEEKVA